MLMFFYNRKLLRIGGAFLMLFLPLTIFNLAMLATVGSWFLFGFSVFSMAWVLFVLHIWYRDFKKYRARSAVRQRRSELIALFAGLTTATDICAIASRDDRKVVVVQKKGRFLAERYTATVIDVNDDFDYSPETMKNLVNLTLWIFTFFVGREVEVLKLAEAIMLDESHQPVFMKPASARSTREQLKAFRETPDHLKFADASELEDIIRLITVGTVIDSLDDKNS